MSQILSTKLVLDLFNLNYNLVDSNSKALRLNLKVYSPVGKSYGQKAYTPQRLDYNVVARRVGTGQVLARLGHD